MAYRVLEEYGNYDIGDLRVLQFHTTFAARKGMRNHPVRERENAYTTGCIKQQHNCFR
jgi:hypothetical protein